MAEKQSNTVTEDAKSFLEAFLRRQNKESYQNEFNELILKKHLQVVAEIRHKSSNDVDDARVTAQIGMESVDGELILDSQNLSHHSRNLERIRKEQNETPNSIDSADSKTPMGTASSATISERGTPDSELKQHHKNHFSQPLLHLHSCDGSSYCEKQKKVHNLSQSFSATMNVSHQSDSPSSSRHSSIPKDGSSHRTHVDLVFRESTYPELEAVLHTEVKHNSLKRETSKEIISRSLSQGDVDSKNIVSSSYFIRPKKDSDRTSGSSTCSKSGTIDKGYEADVDIRQKPKKSKSRGSSFFNKLRSITSSSNSGADKQEVKKLAMDYVKSQGGVIARSPPNLGDSTTSKSSSPSPDVLLISESIKSLPPSRNRMSASSLPDKSEASIVRQCSNKVVRVSSMVGGNIQKLTGKRAPLAEIEDFEDVSQPPEKKLSERQYEKEKKKKKKKWYKSSSTNENVFTKLFHKNQKGRIQGHLGGGVVSSTSISQLESSGYKSLEVSQPHKRRLSIPSANTTGPEGTSDATKQFSELINTNPGIATSTPKPEAPVNGFGVEVPLLNGDISADRTKLRLDLNPGLINSSTNDEFKKPQIVLSKNNNETVTDGISPISSNAPMDQETKQELAALLLDDIAKLIQGKELSQDELICYEWRRKKVKELAEQDQSFTGGRSRNVSGTSVNTVRERMDSNLTTSSSCTDITVMGEPISDVDIKTVFDAKSKRLKKYLFDTDILSELSFPDTYDHYSKELSHILGSKPGWRSISMLYFITRRIIICLELQVSTDYTEDDIKNYTEDEIKKQTDVIKQYTLKYFEEKYSRWVENQGGWIRMVVDSEDTDVD